MRRQELSKGEMEWGQNVGAEHAIEDDGIDECTRNVGIVHRSKHEARIRNRSVSGGLL